MSSKVVVGCGLSNVGNKVVARVLQLLHKDVHICNDLSECVRDVVRVIPVITHKDLISSLAYLNDNKCKVRDESLVFVFNYAPADVNNIDYSSKYYAEFKRLIFDADFNARHVFLPKMEGFQESAPLEDVIHFCQSGGYMVAVSALNHIVERCIKLSEERQRMVDKVKLSALYVGSRHGCDGLPTTAEEAEAWEPPAWALYYSTIMQNKITELENALVEEIGNRDKWEEKATCLSEAVGECFGLDVGEHSSANCPIRNATEILENHLVLKDV